VLPYSEDASLRIKVSGIKKGPVRRNEKGIVEEDDLSSFFHDAGCKVAGVRLVIDPKRRNASRGFGFVDFEDHESLDLAMKLHNKEAKELADKNGKLRIEKAHSVAEKGKKRAQELMSARKQTEEIEPDLAVHEAWLNELVREGKKRKHELQLQEEKRRRAAMRQASETVEDVEQQGIHTVIDAEEERTTAIEDVISVDGELARQHQDEASVCDNSSATLAFLPRDDLVPPAVTSGPTQHNGGGTQGSGAIAVEQQSKPSWDGLVKPGWHGWVDL